MSSHYVTSSLTLVPQALQSSANNSNSNSTNKKWNIIKQNSSNNITTCPTLHRFSNNCPANFPCEHGHCVWQQDPGVTSLATGDSNTHLSPVNAVRLVCECDNGWLGLSCQVCCPLACGNGTCVTGVNTSVTCRCDWGYTGARCDVLAPSNNDAANTTLMVAIATPLAVLLLVSASLVGVLVYLRFKRYPIFLKVTSFFHPSPASIIVDDLMRYDVFISYRCHDDDDLFVSECLVPQLETLGYKICVHYRQFVAGQAIVDNIVRAIQASCHTLLVLSPAYVTSEWTKFEYQVAQLEMLKQRHLIVPVIFRDISHLSPSVLDANLAVILSSVTYLTWPASHGNDDDVAKQQEFWRALRRALGDPRKFENQDPDWTAANKKACDVIACPTNQNAEFSRPKASDQLTTAV